MQGRYLYFGNMSTASLGLVYSTFTETMPQPKEITVDIPGGNTIDVSDYASSIGYGQGTHVLTFLLYGTTEQERLDTKSRLMTYMHGARRTYYLSWRSNHKYVGRASVAFEHRWDNVDVVTITIKHDPFATVDEVRKELHGGASSASASTATETFDLEGSSMLYTIKARLYQTGTVRVGTSSAVSFDNEEKQLGTFTNRSSGSGKLSVTVSLDQWWIGNLSDSGELILNQSHFTVGTDATTDSDWTLGGTNLKCDKYSTVQLARISYTGKGF